MELVRASGRKRGGEGDGLTCNGVLEEPDDAAVLFMHMSMPISLISP